MEAKAVSLNFFNNDSIGAIKIPYFQRPYVWGKENWRDLLDDMLDSKGKHFLGSIILKKQTQVYGEKSSVLVIDGQQRLTTLTLLLKAVFDSFNEEMRGNTRGELKSLLFFKHKSTDSQLRLRIQHSHFDEIHFRAVMEAESKLDSSQLDKLIEASNNRTLSCYKYFIDELAKLSQDNLTDLFNGLLSSDSPYLVMIIIGDEEDEQSIFDTINSAGVRLTGADIVKNALFQKAKELMSADEVESLYKKYWDQIFSCDEETIAYWCEEKTTGRLKRDNLEILLHSIGVIQGFFDPDINTLSELSSVYKTKIKSLNRDEIKKFAQDISEYAALYKNKVFSFNKSSFLSFQDYSQRIFHILEVCEISTFHPYILSILYKYQDNESVLQSKLAELEKLVIHNLISKGETRSYNKFCKEFIEDDTKVVSKLNEINYEDLAKGLRKISNKAATLVLFWVELHRRSIDNKQSIKELKYNYSLEHILPQKWEEFWSDVPVRDFEGNEITEEEKAKLVRYETLYEIGNMTLLSGPLNSSLRNSTYLDKLRGDGKKKGISSYRELSITGEDVIDKYDGENSLWDEVAIRQRTKILEQEIFEIWPQC